MKTVVFITGTNAVGKSTLAKTLQARFGGIAATRDDVTYCKNGICAFAGSYTGRSIYGGVDAIKNDKGSSCTSRLSEVVTTAFKTRDVIFCEGMMLHTFGINLTNAFFLGDRGFVVFLYAPGTVIDQRLMERSGRKVTESILRKQGATAASARKWASIGVPVVSFDTSKTTAAEIADLIINRIPELCTK